MKTIQDIIAELHNLAAQAPKGMNTRIFCFKFTEDDVTEFQRNNQPATDAQLSKIFDGFSYHISDAKNLDISEIVNDYT